MKNGLKIGAVSLVGLVGLFMYGCGPAASTIQTTANNNAVVPNTNASAPDDLTAGRDMYKQNCASCHRDAGTGGKITIDGKPLNPKDLTSERMKNRSDKKLFEDISEGAPDDGMPAFKEQLTESQIKETIRFIRAELQNVPVTTPR